MLVTKPVNVGARHIAGDPASGSAPAAERGGIVRLAGRRRDFPVERHRGLERDQRRLITDIFSEGLVQGLCLLFKNSGSNSDSGIAQALKAFSSDQRIGVLHAGSPAADSGFNDGIRTRSGAALVAAGFQVNVQGGSASLIPRLLQGKNLGVLDAVKRMAAFTDNPPFADDDRPHTRVGRS